jgi:hypothetical protein
MSAEGNEVVRKIIAQTFDDTSHAFIDAIHESLPHIPRNEIVWRSHFLLGALYYSLVTPGARVAAVARQVLTARMPLTRSSSSCVPTVAACRRRRSTTRSRCRGEDAMFAPTIPGPDPDTKTPVVQVPPLACDAHCHIFGPGAEISLRA